tara:strand:+ start:559 stop:891 length:333 start_codon:yes stop_codon:yes gene_type:complete
LWGLASSSLLELSILGLDRYAPHTKNKNSDRKGAKLNQALELQAYKETKMLSINEVAERLGISKNKVREFINSGELPSLKYSDRITKVRLIDLELFNTKNRNNNRFDYKL